MCAGSLGRHAWHLCCCRGCDHTSAGHGAERTQTEEAPLCLRTHLTHLLATPFCRSPQHQDLQRLASQVLMGETMNLQELQKKMESQQASLAELLKVIKPE